MQVGSFRNALFASVAAFGLSFAAPTHASAQVSFGVNIGPAPVCPYGFYGYAPYNCAPYGYYGPEWFSNGGFIGAGPWYRGRPGFYGHVNRGFDPRYGYHGAFPGHNEHFDRGHDFRDFHGNDMHGVHGERRQGGRGPR
jgi:hypothetical protein